MNRDTELMLKALQKFAAQVTQKMGALAAGEPEDQLRAPLEVLLRDYGRAISREVVAKGESKLPGRLGRPDYAVLANRLLVGYVEVKAPGTGAQPIRFRGHDKRQWERFQGIPNLIYTDGNEWGLYRDGQAVRSTIRLVGDVTTMGVKAINERDATALRKLLADFLSWNPIIPKKADQLAKVLAPLCRMLRDDVADALKDENSPLVQLAKDWRQLLFPDAGDERFADAYAQTVTFALLLSKSEGARTLDIDDSVKALADRHSLLSRALAVLTDPQAQVDIAPSLGLLQRVIDCVPTSAMEVSTKDPWLYFYEDFLAAYDAKLRKDAGAYYTPVEVVRAQVRLLDDLLTNKLGKPLGFVEDGVVTLDPAAGTGTYLLGVIDHAPDKVRQEEGPGAVPARMGRLAEQLYGFEIMVGPYSVAELRTSRAFKDRGAAVPESGPGVYLTDTLESPHTEPPQMPLFLQPLADQHKRALKVKDKVPVLVCLGNPPYDRHGAADDSNRSRTGGWVRWSDDGSAKGAIFNAFIEPAKDAGHGGDVKNLYNLYVYFWRWALWKVFEQRTPAGPGIVSFITASSYLDGDAFVGMREHMRRVCDEIWIMDLGGEGRGTRQTDNVFAIQTPVAITVAARYGQLKKSAPANVHYVSIEGSRSEKLEKLEAIAGFADFAWEDCPEDWAAPFRPAGSGVYFTWPLLTDLMPWQHSGVQVKRTWPIGPNEETLKSRWRALLKASDRIEAFGETSDRQINASYHVPLTARTSSTPIGELPTNAPTPPVEPYAFRMLDRQRILADGRLISRPRLKLWNVHSDKQVYVTTLLNHPLGRGAALATCADIPDMHHFRGSYGAKEVFPLYRDAAGRHANITPELLTTLSRGQKQPLGAEDLLAYLYGILAHPAFTDEFASELATRELRVPITKDASLFEQVRDVGRRLLWLHTYGERFVPKGRRKGRLPRGKARAAKPVSHRARDYPDEYGYVAASKTLWVGNREFRPVEPEVWGSEVSGLKVVKSWLGYRMRRRRGKRSSPLDDIHPERWTPEFTTELLHLLWILEATLAEYPQQRRLLAQVSEGPLFTADGLPAVPADSRRPPDGQPRFEFA